MAVGPGGTFENSPAFQHWVEAGKQASPKGAKESRATEAEFCRSSGTVEYPLVRPSVETLGYVHVVPPAMNAEFSEGITARTDNEVVASEKSD